MGYVIIEQANALNNPDRYMRFQIESNASDDDTTIQTELATLPDCGPGSVAINAKFDLMCVKKNNGTSWEINRP